MKPRALFVEDDPRVALVIEDILDSLGHDHDHATDVETARSLIAEQQYHYILLDRSIPVRQGRIARPQNGDNLFEELLALPALQDVPLIIVTGNDVDGPDRAVDMVKAGAFDYVPKPFKTTGKTLDKVIKRALKVNGPQAQPKSEKASFGREKKFSGGPLVFFDDRAELCGVTIISDRNTGQTLMMLRELAKKKKDGSWLNLSGDTLMRNINADGIGAITGAVKTLRSNCSKRLKKSLNLKCANQDVIVNDEQGYYLNDLITLGNTPNKSHGKRRAQPCSNKALERRNGILALLKRSGGMSAKEVASKIKVSEKTIARDIDVLRESGQSIVREGPKKTGVYRVAG